MPRTRFIGFLAGTALAAVIVIGLGGTLRRSLTRVNRHGDEPEAVGSDIAALGLAVAPVEGLAIWPQPAFSGNQLRLEGLSTLAITLAAETPGSPEPVLTVAWSVNGQEVAQGEILDPSWFQAEDVISARVLRVGESGEGETVAETSIQVLNAPPRVQSVRLLRPSEQPGELQAIANAVDPDGDLLTLQYTWLVDGSTVAQGEANRLDVTSLQRGQSVQVQATASDGTNTSAPLMSDVLRLDNQPPRIEVGTASILRGLKGARTLQCALKLEDPDGDPVTLRLIEAPAGLQWDAETGALLYPLPNGLDEIKITVEATDDRGGKVVQDLRLSL